MSGRPAQQAHRVFHLKRAATSILAGQAEVDRVGVKWPCIDASLCERRQRQFNSNSKSTGRKLVCLRGATAACHTRVYRQTSGESEVSTATTNMDSSQYRAGLLTSISRSEACMQGMGAVLERGQGATWIAGLNVSSSPRMWHLC